jgi:hypothetical protein
MTMREEFEAWSGNHETNGLIYSVEWAAWQAAYRAGQEACRKSLKPVAWGVPNSRTPERQPFLSLLHQLPQDGGVDGRRKTPLYPAMLVPLYRMDDQP